MAKCKILNEVVLAGSNFGEWKYYIILPKHYNNMNSCDDKNGVVCN